MNTKIVHVVHDAIFGGLLRQIVADHLATQTITKDNDWSRTVNFIRAIGARALAMEYNSVGENPKLL